MNWISSSSGSGSYEGPAIGVNALSGTVAIGGAKNAALPLMAASLLTAEPLVLANLPDLADITTMANLLVQHGVAISLGSPDGDGGSAEPGRVVELTCHPGYLDAAVDGRDGSMTDGQLHRRAREFELLRRPEFLHAVRAAGFEPVPAYRLTVDLKARAA